MNVFERSEWGARPARASTPATHHGWGTVHWSASPITPAHLDTASKVGAGEAVKPKKPGAKWYRLWRDPTTPKAQRRAISKQIKKYNVALRKFKIASLAHSDPKLIAMESAIVRQFQNFHMDTHGWNDIGYHRVIFASGNVYLGRPYGTTGAHAIGANWTVGYCLVMTRGDVASAAMLDSFHVMRLRDRVTKYKGHRQWPGNWTECPGEFLISALNLPQE